MNIALITGSCGLVGSEASIFFAKKGFKIIGIDNNTRKFFFGKDGDISWMSVTRILVPDAPIGWPNAIAPPLTFTFSSGKDNVFITAILCAAKASLISKY